MERRSCPCFREEFRKFKHAPNKEHGVNLTDEENEFAEHGDVHAGNDSYDIDACEYEEPYIRNILANVLFFSVEAIFSSF